MGELDDAIGRLSQECALRSAWHAAVVSKEDVPVLIPTGRVAKLLKDFIKRINDWDEVWIGTGPDGIVRVVSNPVYQSRHKGHFWYVLFTSKKREVRAERITKGARAVAGIVIAFHTKKDLDTRGQCVFRVIVFSDGRIASAVPRCDTTQGLDSNGYILAPYFADFLARGDKTAPISLGCEDKIRYGV